MKVNGEFRFDVYRVKENADKKQISGEFYVRNR